MFRRQWVDLPSAITEKILELLPLSDYVRSASVCRHWQSIQSEHRRRHSPSPPPMLALPWVISEANIRDNTISYYSPLERRYYRIPCPDDLDFQESLIHLPHNCSWLLFSGKMHTLTLANPISRQQIILQGTSTRINLAVVSPPPAYMVSLSLEDGKILLLRECDQNRHWTETYELAIDDKPFRGVLCQGIHYYLIMSKEDSNDLLLVDPLSFPMPRYIKMTESSNIEEIECPEHLVESDGELVLVKRMIDPETGFLVGIRICRADLTGGRWVRMESLGDRSIIFHGGFCVSVLAANNQVRRNCIYFTESMSDQLGRIVWTWKVFDMGTERLLEVPLSDIFLSVQRDWRWFMPTIC